MLAEERAALLADVRKGDEMLMAWFKAASPYDTPGSLESGLKVKEEEIACAMRLWTYTRRTPKEFSRSLTSTTT